MRKNYGTKSWFYPLPVLIIGTYNEDGTAGILTEGAETYLSFVLDNILHSESEGDIHYNL